MIGRDSEVERWRLLTKYKTEDLRNVIDLTGQRF